ncbi:MAG: glycosyltransferase [Candidatus Bathyarchaeia archaeon]
MRTEPLSVAMVGDCAYVGETLIKYAPPWIKYTHKRRTRGLYSKTLGILFKILFTKAEIFHVHYGLQDHYLVKMLKRQPTVCQFHGSDLRYTLNTRLGWIVKKNLKTADRILVSVPDIIKVAKYFREDAEYLPNPVNLHLFKPAPLPQTDRFRVLLASSLSTMRGADIFLKGFAKFQRNHPNCAVEVIDYGNERWQLLSLLKSLNVKCRVHPRRPHEEMASLYHHVDVVATDFRLPYLHMTSLEAMACHRPVLQSIDNSLYGRNGVPPPPPVVSVEGEEGVVEGLTLLVDPPVRERVAEAQEKYIHAYHNPSQIIEKVACIYTQLLK